MKNGLLPKDSIVLTKKTLDCIDTLGIEKIHMDTKKEKKKRKKRRQKEKLKRKIIDKSKNCICCCLWVFFELCLIIMFCSIILFIILIS